MTKVPLFAVYLAGAVLPLLAVGCRDDEEHHANLQLNLQEDRAKDGGVYFIYSVNYAFTITFPNINLIPHSQCQNVTCLLSGRQMGTRATVLLRAWSMPGLVLSNSYSKSCKVV